MTWHPPPGPEQDYLEAALLGSEETEALQQLYARALVHIADNHPRSDLVQAIQGTGETIAVKRFVVLATLAYVPEFKDELIRQCSWVRIEPFARLAADRFAIYARDSVSVRPRRRADGSPMMRPDGRAVLEHVQPTEPGERLPFPDYLALLVKCIDSYARHFDYEGAWTLTTKESPTNAPMHQAVSDVPPPDGSMQTNR